MPPSPRWRLARTISAMIEIAASAAIAIRIGTSGEDPLSLSCDVEESCWSVCCGDDPSPPLEPPAGLPWPVPPLPPPPGELPALEDEFPAPEPLPEPDDEFVCFESPGAVAPPPELEDLAEGS